MVTSMHIVQKAQETDRTDCQKLGNKLYGQLVDGRRFKCKNREIELISKKSLKKRKREDVQNKKLIAAPCEEI